jgi:hypothetical protein
MAADLFVGPPDARQAEGEIAVTRFRPSYRALSEHEKTLHDEIKQEAVYLEELFDQVPKGRYRSLALTALEEAVMWIIKGLTQ